MGGCIRGSWILDFRFVRVSDHVFLNADVHIYHKKTYLSFPGVAKDFAPSRGHVYGSFKGIVTYL